MRKYAVILLFMFFQAISLRGQPGSADTSFHQAAITSALSFYAGAQGEHAGLYTGSEYSGYRYPLLKEHPFFASDKAIRGAIYYDGVHYDNIPMWYDLVNDRVIVLNEFGNVKVVLHNRKVKYFSLSGHHFVRTDSLSALPAGFYDQLYSGPSTLLAKRSKSTTQVIDDMTTKTAVRRNNDQYYILKDGISHRFAKPSSIKKILHDKRREIQQFMKTSKISFRRSREGAMVEILAYYDLLTRK